ncbi:MAG: ABC transporter ATP-binding protein [Thaumarchaeota archaeon]|nr:ABC transporter ATP-binding protein [Candidatus Geocrenenecus arthurdayi]
MNIFLKKWRHDTTTMSQSNEVVKYPERGEILVKAENIVKGFPGIWEHLILDHVNFDVRAGEIHALLGENGAGKTVLANILSGFYLATSGNIYVRGKPVKFNSPKDALEHGIAMVHQEFTLVPTLTVAENIALGLRKYNSFTFPINEVEEKLRELSQRYGLKIDPRAKIEDLSAGEKQRAEILKVLYWNPQVLILDEPTSMLTPYEVEELFKALRSMAAENKGIVFITHKIEEVLSIADRVTVLRLGKHVGTKNITETNKDELLRMMIGIVEPVKPVRREITERRPILEVIDLHVIGREGFEAVRGVSFTIFEGEIFGIAGVAGNGQSELVEALTGLRSVKSGKIIFMGRDITNKSPRELSKLGIRHIPEDRRAMGVAESMTFGENIMMRDYFKSPFSRAGILNYNFISKHARELINKFEILTPDVWDTEVRILSGGNIQRLILARELWVEPKLIIAYHPTYGLDLKALTHTHKLFLQLREKGSAILLVSEDLEEIMLLCDRIAVMFNGEFMGILDSSRASVREIGMMMAGIKYEAATN